MEVDIHRHPTQMLSVSFSENNAQTLIFLLSGSRSAHKMPEFSIRACAHLSVYVQHTLQL